MPSLLERDKGTENKGIETLVNAWNSGPAPGRCRCSHCQQSWWKFAPTRLPRDRVRRAPGHAASTFSVVWYTRHPARLKPASLLVLNVLNGTPRPKPAMFLGPLGLQRRLKQCRAVWLRAPSCKGADPSSLVGIALKPVRKATDNDINSKKQGKKIFKLKSEKFSHLCLRLVCVIQSSGNCELDWKSYLPGPLTKLGKLSPWEKEGGEKF